MVFYNFYIELQMVRNCSKLLLLMDVFMEHKSGRHCSKKGGGQSPVASVSSTVQLHL